MGSLLLSLGSWCVQAFIYSRQKSVSSVLCKFWLFYGGINGDLLQEGLCHTQVYCTQSPCTFSSPLLTHISTGDTQTQFWLSLCGVSGSWCAQGLFESSEQLWWVWGLILNFTPPTMLLGLLLCPYTWGIFFFFWWVAKCQRMLKLPHNCTHLTR